MRLIDSARVRTFTRRTMALARAEVLHVARDRAMMAQLVLVPIIQLLILSNVATFAIRNSPIYVVDFDRSPVSRGLVSRVGSSGFFELKGLSSSPAAGNDQLLDGRATVVLTIPHDFEESLRRTGAGSVHVDINSEKGSAAAVVQSYLVQILNAYAADMRPTARPATRIVTRVRHRYNPTLNYKHYMVPGILVALVTMVGTLVTAQNVAREREMGTLEQLNVTPLSKAELITAKLLPFWVLALVNLAIGLLVARLVYDVPMRGNLPLLFACAGLYLVVALGIGLWISTAVETQQQAMFLTFFVLMIYLLMSGLFTPIDSMPRWVQLLSELNPVRHFVAISRAILVKGAGLVEIVRPLAILALYAVVVPVIAISRYQKRIA